MSGTVIGSVGSVSTEHLDAYFLGSRGTVMTSPAPVNVLELQDYAGEGQRFSWKISATAVQDDVPAHLVVTYKGLPYSKTEVHHGEKAFYRKGEDVEVWFYVEVGKGPFLENEAGVRESDLVAQLRWDAIHREGFYQPESLRIRKIENSRLRAESESLRDALIRERRSVNRLRTSRKQARLMFTASMGMLTLSVATLTYGVLS